MTWHLKAQAVVFSPSSYKQQCLRNSQVRHGCGFGSDAANTFWTWAPPHLPRAKLNFRLFVGRFKERGGEVWVVAEVTDARCLAAAAARFLFAAWKQQFVLTWSLLKELETQCHRTHTLFDQSHVDTWGKKGLSNTESLCVMAWKLAAGIAQFCCKSIVRSLMWDD